MDIPTLLRAMAALALTVGLMIGLAVLLRRFGVMQLTGAPVPGSRRRLSVEEQLWIEPGRTRLMIVRCDGQEHLLLLGPQGASRIAAAAPEGATVVGEAAR